MLRDAPTDFELDSDCIFRTLFLVREHDAKSRGLALFDFRLRDCIVGSKARYHHTNCNLHLWLRNVTGNISPLCPTILNPTRA
jgi:hypothetical protein